MDSLLRVMPERIVMDWCVKGKTLDAEYCHKFNLIQKIVNNNFKGQKQKWFLFKLKKDVNITFEHDPDNEFDDFNWVPYWYPLSVIVSFKEEVYREALNKLRYSFCKEFSNV
jgi:8-oxo-dGTP pyrophosphatase MutT (NUDIX family)